MNVKAMSSVDLNLFTRTKAWLPIASGEARLALEVQSKQLHLDFDFMGGGGFVVARREIKRRMPQDFEISFRWCGRGPVNHLELKLVDDTGANVWRYERRDLKFTGRWSKMVVSSRDLHFAWGPAGGGTIRKLGAIEFAIVAKDGGAGKAWISDVCLEDQSFTAKPALTRSRRAPHWITLDAGAVRALGGLIIDWKKAAPLDGFQVDGSLDGKRWRRLYRATRAGGARSFVSLPNTRTRWLRITSGDAVAKAVRVQPFEFSRSPESFWPSIAAHTPRGWHPRWLLREQSLWTPFGTPDRRDCALINEQGMVELAEGSCSLEPFVQVSGKRFTWADVATDLALEDEWKPEPKVTWNARSWSLEIAGQGLSDHSLRVTYHFTNHSRRKLTAKLFVALRPFQVTPPWQHFRNVGGVSRIERLSRVGSVVRVNESLSIHAPAEAAFGAMTFDEGNLVERLIEGRLPSRDEVDDDVGFASGVLSIELKLQAGESREFHLGTSTTSARPFDWKAKLSPERWSCANGGAEVLRAMHTAMGHVLLTRSGPALQPGPRRYTRSWIRDGTIMSAALLRMGCADEVREFIDWYAPHQRADGFVPCCVDRDGVDWLVEHDSHGQFIALIADYVRFTGDEVPMKRHWLRVVKAVNFIERSLEANGLMPISASHEGYLAQPVHSFWDGFWTWRGLRDAVWLADRLGKKTKWQTLMERVRESLARAIQGTRAKKQLDYNPGSVEWADFDPTATANAITLLDVPEQLDRTAIEWTFDKYLIDWRRKRTGELPWTNYTPYEIRIIGALVRLGLREAALELLRFCMSDRRPLAWNQWPEIAWRDPLAPAHIGDVPHTWIAAEFVLAVRSLFVFEDETRQQLVLAAGIDAEWMKGNGIRLSDVPTIFGRLDFSLVRASASSVKCLIAGNVAASGGLVLRPPLKVKHLEVLQGQAELRRNEVVIRSASAHLLLHT
ncbi:MAG: hypothetical protein JNM99_13045 [Verrucomicrobiaceae bacterium]|nr:hypothetical protein [Verrucomicrobiaceae bacterium]